VLTLDAEKVSSAKQHLEQVNIELEARADQLTADYTEYKLKYDQLGESITTMLNMTLSKVDPSD